MNEFERLSPEVVAIDGKYYRLMTDEEQVAFIWSKPEDETDDEECTA